MKTTFTHKHFDDKILITLFVDGKKKHLFSRCIEKVSSHTTKTLRMQKKACS